LANRTRSGQPETVPLPANPIQSLIGETSGNPVALTVISAEEDYTIIIDGDEYHLKGFPDFTIDSTMARSLVSSWPVRYDDVIESPENLSSYGLDPPAVTVEIAFANQAVRTFLLGDQTPSGLRYYLMEQGQPDVYLVYPSVGAAWLLPQRELHTAVLPSITVEDITKVSLTCADGETITVEYCPARQSLSTGVLWITSPIEYEASSEKIDEYFRHIQAISLKGFAAETTSESLFLYGLAHPRYHLTVYSDDEAGTRTIIRELRIGDARGDDVVYTRLDDSNDVYMLDQESVAFLSSVSTAKLIDRFANIINIAYVERIHVASSSIVDTLLVERTSETDNHSETSLTEKFRINNEPADETTFRQLYQLIIGTLVDGLLPDGWVSADEVKPVLTVTYGLIESQDDEVIEYLPYNADFYAVRRNGVCLFYILKSRVDVIPEALAAYKAGTFDPSAYGL
ncbi:MAG: DUF4340 domain-containing protein, partial [Clostridia bacterium]|nr:DUF4340 domain-containing protein [Clostridia bacterium]